MGDDSSDLSDSGSITPASSLGSHIHLDLSKRGAWRMSRCEEASCGEWSEDG